MKHLQISLFAAIFALSSLTGCATLATKKSDCCSSCKPACGEVCPATGKPCTKDCPPGKCCGSDKKN